MADINLKELLVDLASMTDGGVGDFRTKWWSLYHSSRYSDEYLLERRDELRLLWQSVCNLPSAPETPARAWDLIESWSEWHNTLEEHICQHWLAQRGAGWRVEWKLEARRIYPNPMFLPGMLAFGCVKYGDRLAYCWNPGCRTPFFFADRKGQKHCSKECAEPAKREAKRKWWRENRGKATR